MTTDNNVTEEENQVQALQEQQAKQIIMGVYTRTLQLLHEEFKEYNAEGEIINNPHYGPIFTFTLKTKDHAKEYTCGFFINELIDKLKDDEAAKEWIASFYLDLVDDGNSKFLPAPPQSEEETKAIFDGYIVPHCAKTIREEFPSEQVYVDIDIHENRGPVLEAGFPSIQDGNNVCAMPFHYLLTLYLLNRDPADPLLNGLYKIREENGLE